VRCGSITREAEAMITSKTYQVETRRVPKGALRREVGEVKHGLCGEVWEWGTKHICKEKS
jgi:hypothetical protein